MGRWNPRDHNAEDHIHTDIQTCYIEEPQQKYHLATVNNRLLCAGGGGDGGLNMFTGSKPSPIASAVVRNVWSA